MQMPSEGKNIVMPSQGLGAATIPLMEFRNVPQRYQDAMEAGLGFFELRLPGFRKGFDKRIFGPYDVKCQRVLIPGSSRHTFETTWATGNAACITYELSDRGVAIAFMPDDKYWHNRVQACDVPVLYDGVFAYHHSTGLRQSQQIKAELKALRDVLSEDVEIFKVMMDGRENTFHYKKVLADKDVEALGKRYPRSEIVVVSGVKLEKKEYIKKQFCIFINKCIIYM
jgi:hypothetical protein